MYAVVTTGGKQYRVEAGSELVVERLAADAGASITFDRVLLIGDGEAVTVGRPTVEGASVSGTVLGEALGPKLIVFKFKQKATYRRKNGHRQHMTRVRIDEIRASTDEAKTEEAKAEASVEGEAPGEKPKRTRKPAAKAADTGDAPDEKKRAATPTRRRKKAAKAESEE